MENTRNTYAKKAITQIPRLLGLLDRNKYSPTYGCFHRDYWLDKTSDFPDAVRQFAAHALALVYRHDFPESPYKNNPKIRDWTIASLEFWASIQHNDGSFDEFYPYERGWVGPTAFTTYSSIEALNLLGNEIPYESRTRIEDSIRKAALFISAGDSERDDLANHHAMACLSVWKAYELLKEDELKEGFEKLWKGFLKYHDGIEGWSLEYDGVDPGYLSATVSFLSKIYQTNPDRELLNVIQQSIKFCSYFVYPNGYYGGSTGSRNTLHFYPHGFEIMATEIPLAGAVAEKMLTGLSEGKLVPPEIISDRYVVYRVPEYLQSYLDWQDRIKEIPKLPHEKTDLQKIADLADKSLLIVDDDNPLRDRLARAMEKKGFKVAQADSVEKAINQVKNTPPAFAIVDLRLGDGNGLKVVEEIQKHKKDSRVIMLTGYGNIPTAVEAVKAGAIDYIPKPADADDVENALLASPKSKAIPPTDPMSADRVKWEHINRIFELCNRNVSETARKLKMHRRTLQRILSKRSPK